MKRFEGIADRAVRTRAVRAAAVLPAAGASRRMGRPKLLLPFAGGTVIGGTLTSLLAGGADRVAVVTAPGDGELAAWAQDREGVVAVVNPDPSRGMLSSVRCGLDALGGPAALAAGATPLLVTPADLPALAAATVAAVTAALTAGALAVPLHDGRRGHPLAIAPHLLPEVGELDLDAGLRQLLERHAGAVVEVPVDDPGCLRDVDTPEDYRRLSGRELPPEPPED